MPGKRLTLTKPGVTSLRELQREAYEKSRRIYGANRCIWPVGFDDGSYETRRRFVYEVVWTLHEQTGLPTRITPKAYIDWMIWHWCDCREKREQLILWKPRRVLASWIYRALELHDMGLIPGDHLIANETFPDAERHVWRYQFIYTQIQRHKPSWGLEDTVTKGSTASKDGDVDAKRLESVTLPNSSLLRAVNADPKSLYGEGVRSIVLEEPHTYRDLDGMISQAAILTMTGNTAERGHIVIIGNTAPIAAWVRTFERDGVYIQRDEDDPVSAPYPSTVYRNARGNRVLDLRYQSDPEKDQAFVDREKPNIPNWNVEMEKDYHVVSGDPIYPSFHLNKHCPKLMRDQAWSHPDPRYSFCSEDSYYILALDSGTNTRNHAGVLCEVRYAQQINEYQLIVVKEFVLLDHNNKPRPSDFFELARYARDWTIENLPLMFWEDVDWCGDETIRTKSGLTGQSVVSKAKEGLGCGARSMFTIHPVSNDWDARRDAVNWFLLGWASDECPRLLLNSYQCPILTEGLAGKYCWRPPANPSEHADQRVPDKGAYSHVANALEYACVRARGFIRGKVRRRA